jgi:ribosome-binding factor A
MSKIKQDRMNDRIRELLSELMLREVSDPRLQHITITEVKLDPELMYANIYINALGDENRQQQVMAGLERAKGFLRRELAKRVRLRNAPDLHFHWDETLERGERMNALLNELDIPGKPAQPAKRSQDGMNDE